jgi:hypothetical protein
MTQNSDFDWVAVRSACTASRIFTQRQLGAERDVVARNSTLPANAGYGYALQSSGPMFSVVLNGNGVARMVIFELGAYAVSVRRGDTNETWEVTPTINDNGECRLRMGNRDYECWQFRKLVLESLLFDNPWR